MAAKAAYQVPPLRRKEGPLRFKTQPWGHQREEFMRYRSAKARARFWTMRTGKTKVTLDEAAFMYHVGLISAVIVIAPNTVHENWVLKEFPTHCAVPYEALIYKAAKAKQKGVLARFQHLCLNRDDLKVLSVPSSALRTETAKQFLLTFINRHGGKVLVIFDEAHDFKKPGSKRTITARGVALKCEFRRLLTGTPIHGNPMNAYSEFELLEKGALGFTSYEEFKAYFGLWEARKTRAGRSYIQFLGPQNEEELTRRMEKFTTVLRREDVPGLMRPLNIERLFELTDKQRKVYDALEENPVLDGEVLDGGVYFQKLQQIGSGFLITKTNGLVELVEPEENPRFNLIMNEVQKAEGKVIVWLQYHYEFDVMRKLLTDADIGFSEVHGKSGGNHIQTIYEFVRSNSKKVIFGHALSGGVGGDLSVCNTILWGSHTFDLIQRDQASERGSQIGKLPVDLIDIIGLNTIDSYILNALNNKLNIADVIAATGLVELKRLLKESYV
jgi:hypothetical protein